MKTKLFYVVVHHYGWSTRYTPGVTWISYADSLYLVLVDDEEDLLSKIKHKLPTDVCIYDKSDPKVHWEDAWKELCEKELKHPFEIYFKEINFDNRCKDISTGGLERHNLERGAKALGHSLPPSEGYEKYQAHLVQL